MAHPQSHNYTLYRPLEIDPAATVLQGCIFPPELDISALKPYLALSMSLARHQQALEAKIRSLSPEYNVSNICSITGPGIQELYNAELAGGELVQFTLPPESWTTSLRSERELLGSEASLLKWLSSVPSQVAAEYYDDEHDFDVISESDEVEDEENEDAITEHDQAQNSIHTFLPTLIKHGLPKPETRTPEFILSYPSPGYPLSSLPEPLTDRESTLVQYQLGQFFRRMACHVSPTGLFGDAVDVLRRRPPAGSLKQGSFETGYRTWCEVFHYKLEMVLRDLEDLTVNVSYNRIRHSFHRLKHHLTMVTRPVLVAVQGAEEGNILVSRPADNLQSFISRSETTGSQSPGTAGSRDSIKFSGLRDWSNFMFGDPLIATIFRNRPAQGFLDGLNASLSDNDPFDVVPIIEDQPRTHVRLALYDCYHALIGLAKEYYHKRNENTELLYRAQLKDALTKLDTIEDNGSVIPPSNSPPAIR